MVQFVVGLVNFCDRINEFDVVKLLSVIVVRYLDKIKQDITYFVSFCIEL